ncbi:hypothetical protein [Novipirellula artificiosorum]|uniref:Uncharacterized protein n=1 Tax=Novipirellula artificiosorum TaxID=2528016 RepID=A0A5C6DPU2_9BACT|nr:hypothetical protein [Novipirellula artificiosorum]TWU38632.1 hypothetical protein Poly41_31090 [Novipirellula artificiosorum]
MRKDLFTIWIFLLMPIGCGQRAQENTVESELTSQNLQHRVVEEYSPMKDTVDISELGRKTIGLCVPVPYQTEFEHYVATPVMACVKTEIVQLSIRDALTDDEVSEPVKVAARLLDSIRMGDSLNTSELMYSPDPAKKKKLADRAATMLKPIKFFEDVVLGTCMFIGEYAYVSGENVVGAISNLVIPVHIESLQVNFSFGELDQVASEFVTVWAFAKYHFPDRFPYATTSVLDHAMPLGKVCTQVEGNEVAVYLMNGEAVRDNSPHQPKLKTAVDRFQDLFLDFATERYDEFSTGLSEPAAGFFKRLRMKPSFDEQAKRSSEWKKDVKSAGFRGNVFTLLVENTVPADGVGETYGEVLVMVDADESGLLLATYGNMPSAVTAIVQAAQTQSNAQNGDSEKKPSKEEQ